MVLWIMTVSFVVIVVEPEIDEEPELEEELELVEELEEELLPELLTMVVLPP